MKKFGMFALAFALVLGLTQCKKENTTASNDEGVKVPITLNVSGASTGSATGGSRVAVEGETGVVTFENGDVLHVVSNGVYVGTMAYNGTVFCGEINEPTEGEKLHFYFLGNKTPEFNSNNTGCSVVIDDQTEYLPVISYAPSRENYQVGLTTYNATLLNKCALVKFNVTSASEAATCIVGMNNKVTVDFTDNSFEYSQDGEGVITLPAGSGEQWAILLPQDEVTHTDAFSADEMYTGSCATIPVIEENGYLTNGIAVAISLPGGAIDGLFSVSETQQVYFSKGNLQYIGSAATPYWKFADNQWDHFGTLTGQFTSDIGVNRDLFGWGTSGYHDPNDPNNVFYEPWATSESYIGLSINGWGYGPSTNMASPNLSESSADYDWGVHNSITNGGNLANQWRTLSQPEWDYVIQTRTTESNIRWTRGVVNGVNGIILLPDGWMASVYPLNNPNGGNFEDNIISSSDWNSILETNGAVFLPNLLLRRGLSIINSIGCYWSTTYRDLDHAWYLYFDNLDISSCGYSYRCDGLGVRLVRNAE